MFIREVLPSKSVLSILALQFSKAFTNIASSLVIEVSNNKTPLISDALTSVPATTRALIVST